MTMSPKARFLRRIILRFCLVGYAGTLFLIFTLLLRHRSPWSSGLGLPLWIALNAVLWPLAGYGIGAFAWHRMSRRGNTKPGTPSLS